MSSTSGLSSNTSNNQPRNGLQLDASTRDSILARNQAQIMSALGMSQKDRFSSSGGAGGLNPLKGLYSAAAATFLKNKQSQLGEGSTKGLGSYEKAADILKSLAAKKEASSDPGASFQNTNSKVSGPASSTNYKKYQWTGNPGPTGSDVVTEDAPADEAATVEEPSEAANLSAVQSTFSSFTTDAGGSIADRGDGTSDFNVRDLAGTITQEGNKLVGTVEVSSGSYSFEIAADGAVMINASNGDIESKEFEQLKQLLSGNLQAVEAPTEPASTTEPSGTSGTSGSSSTSAIEATAVAVLKTLDDDEYNSAGYTNAKLFMTKLMGADGKFSAKDGDELNISFNGYAGKMTIDKDRLSGEIGSGVAKISFTIEGNGMLTIHGSDSKVLASNNSSALRAALGVTTGGTTKQQFRMVEFNRYGTGLGLNLLG